MIKHLNLLLVLIIILACSQNKQNINTMISELKIFNSQPLYQIKIKSEYSYVIKVNGISILTKNDPFALFTGNNINSCIPSSGIQTLEVIISPKINDNGMKDEFLGNNYSFLLEIEKTEWKNGSLISPELVLKYELPDGDYSNKKKVEYNTTFNADVPYELVDWRKGKTFNMKDSLVLKTKVLKFYENLKYLFEHQKGEEYMSLNQKGLFNLYQGNYFTKEKANEHTQKHTKFISDEKRTMAPIENYTLEISGNGKLLSLRRVDGYNVGEGVLRRYYNKGPQKRVHIEDIVLYIPDNNEQTDYEFEVVSYIGIIRGVLH